VAVVLARLVDAMSAATWGPSRAPIVMQDTLVLRGIRYLPHYRDQGVFVGPGRPVREFGRVALLNAGAVVEEYPLMARGYNT
jgi:hypothetical protein